MLDLYNLCCLIFIISSTDCFYNQQKKKKKCYKKGKQGLQSVKPGGLRRWCQSFLLKLGQIGEVCFACKTSATKAPSMANSPTGTASRAWDQFVWQWGRRHCGQRDAWEEAQPFFCVYWSQCHEIQAIVSNHHHMGARTLFPPLARVTRFPPCNCPHPNFQSWVSIQLV